MLKPSQLSGEIKKLLRLTFSISLAVFLFILFFQPIDLSHFNMNSLILVTAGLGCITFLLLVIFLQVLPALFPKLFSIKEWEAEPDYLTAALIIIFHATAYAFYIRYVGLVSLTMYLMFKVALISILPVVILWVHYKLRWLNVQLEHMGKNSDSLRSLLKENKEIQENKIIELFSENKSEKLHLQLNDIFLIRSADNYIEVVFSDNGQIKKNLIRNTLRNVESQLSIYREFIRCHRTCIVNTNHIEKLDKHYHAYAISFHGYNEQVPVSRQYLLKVKETLGVN